MKKNLSINDELRAIQSGELTCTPDHLAACVSYCHRRLDTLQRSLESRSIPESYQKQAQANIKKFSDFIRWADECSENT